MVYYPPSHSPPSITSNRRPSGVLGTWFLTLLGTLPVLFVHQVNRKLMDGVMGAVGGIMVTASCWSLLVPALEVGGVWRALAGLALGGAAIWSLDRLIPHLHSEFPDGAAAEGPAVPHPSHPSLAHRISLMGV